MFGDLRQSTPYKGRDVAKCSPGYLAFQPPSIFFKVYGTALSTSLTFMAKPSPHKCELTIFYPNGEIVRYLADFVTMTWSVTRMGGYARPDQSGRFLPIHADRFWQAYRRIAAKPEPPDSKNAVDWDVWEFQTTEGATTRRHSGMVPADQFIDADSPDRLTEFRGLFDFLIPLLD